jgi:hypothetical protein
MGIDDPGGKVFYGPVLAASAGFVLAGIALVLLGAVNRRGDEVLIGTVCCLFFGSGAGMLLAILRGSG